MSTDHVGLSRLQQLGPSDVVSVLDFCSVDPVGSVLTEARVRATGLHQRKFGAQLWGFGSGRDWDSLCHVGTNLIPMRGTPQALDAFAARAWIDGARCATMLGLQADVVGLWDRLGGAWSAPRAFRWEQPLLELRRPPMIAPDPLVQQTQPSEFDVVYPACVAMHTEELGVSPELGGATSYRLRVRQLINQGSSFSRIDLGVVVFKAEIAAATPSACQIQGVWVHPDFRGHGYGRHGIAAVAAYAQQHISPTVSLYVNDFNVAAQRAYYAAGFRRRGTFASILF